MHRKKPTILASIAVLGIGFIAGPGARAEGQHEFVLLPSIDAVEVFDESRPDIAESHARATADVVYSYSCGRCRILAEYLLSSDESELERLQLGWSLSDNAMLWVGRFHSPASFWISEFHHGHYLQTSITRPSLEQWEDESGSAPAHISGLKLELTQELEGEAALGLFLGAGLAPRLVEHELKPYDIFDPESGHGLGVSSRISYQPDMFFPAQFGVVSSWTRINVVAGQNPDLAELERIDQMTLGAFADLQWETFRLITSLVYYDNHLRYIGDEVADSYLLAYVQPEYSVSENVTVFGRVDIGHGEDDSPYLTFFPEFDSHHNMLGVRWDFLPSQSLTFEAAEVARQGDNADHETFKEVRLQWSAVLR